MGNGFWHSQYRLPNFNVSADLYSNSTNILNGPRATIQCAIEPGARNIVAYRPREVLRDHKGTMYMLAHWNADIRGDCNPLGQDLANVRLPTEEGPTFHHWYHIEWVDVCGFGHPNVHLVAVMSQLCPFYLPGNPQPGAGAGTTTFFTDINNTNEYYGSLEAGICNSTSSISASGSVTSPPVYTTGGVSCSSPVVIEVGTQYTTESLAEGAAQWYSIPVTNGEVYHVTCTMSGQAMSEPCVLDVYDGTCAELATIMLFSDGGCNSATASGSTWIIEITANSIGNNIVTFEVSSGICP